MENTLTTRRTRLPVITRTKSLKPKDNESKEIQSPRKGQSDDGIEKQRLRPAKLGSVPNEEEGQVQAERSTNSVKRYAKKTDGDKVLPSPYLQAPTGMGPIAETRADCEKKKPFLRPEAEARKRLQQKLMQMQEDAKREKDEREAAERRKEDMAAKLRAKMGVDSIASRLHGPPPKEERDTDERSRPSVLPPIAAEPAPVDPEELARKRAEMALRNRAILERNQQLLQKIAEKRREEEEAVEAVRAKEDQLRRRLKEKVLEAVEAQRQQETAAAPEGQCAAAAGGGRARGGHADVAEPDSPKRADIERAIQSRVKRYQDRFGSEAEEEAWLRKKYGFAEGDRLFNIPGAGNAYQAIREALLERGWREHREDESLVFDLKWTVKTSDIPFKALDREQIVNHFARNGCVTTKVGLTRNLRNLKWFEDVDMDAFFPRSYDLHDQARCARARRRARVLSGVRRYASPGAFRAFVCARG